MQDRDPVAERWGANIRRQRMALGLTQQDLGGALDPPVTQGTVSRWEDGSEPRRWRKVQIAAALRVDPEVLFPMAVAS